MKFQSKHPCPVCRSENIRYWGSAHDIGVKGLKHNIAKCTKCTHLFIHPLPSEEYLTRAYGESDPSVYSDNRFFESRSSGPFTEADRWVWKHIIDSLVPGRFLDIGSANLTLLRRIVAQGWELTIVEPGSHSQLIQQALNSSVYRNVFEECNFEHQFDLISVMDVLEHVGSPIRFLQKIKSCLSTNGIALFRFPNAYSLRCRLEGENWNMIRPLGHLHYFTPRSIRIACDIARLKISYLRSHDLAQYQFFTFKGKSIRGLRFFKPFFKIFDLALLGDQLLVKVAND